MRSLFMCLCLVLVTTGCESFRLERDASGNVERITSGRQSWRVVTPALEQQLAAPIPGVREVDPRQPIESYPDSVLASALREADSRLAEADTRTEWRNLQLAFIAFARISEYHARTGFNGQPHTLKPTERPDRIDDAPDGLKGYDDAMADLERLMDGLQQDEKNQR